MMRPSSSPNRLLNNLLAKLSGLSLYAVVAWLFAVKEREALDEQTGGDKSVGRWTWGL